MYDLALKTKNALLNRDKGKGKGNSDSDSTLILVLFFVSATTYSMCIYMKWVEKVGWMGTTTPPIMAWGRKQRVKSKRSFHLLLYKLLWFESFTVGNEFKYCLKFFSKVWKVTHWYPLKWEVGRRKVLFTTHTSLPLKRSISYFCN